MSAPGHASPRLEELTATALRAIRPQLPDGTGITVFAFDYAPGGCIAYTSTAERSDMFAALREFLRQADPGGEPAVRAVAWEPGLEGRATAIAEPVATQYRALVERFARFRDAVGEIADELDRQDLEGAEDGVTAGVGALHDRLRELADLQVCVACGCSQEDACEGGCWWVTPDLCSTCHDAGLGELLAAGLGDDIDGGPGDQVVS